MATSAYACRAINEREAIGAWTMNNPRDAIDDVEIEWGSRCSDNRSTKVWVKNNNRNRRIRVTWRTRLDSTGIWRQHTDTIRPRKKTIKRCANRAELLGARYLDDGDPGGDAKRYARIEWGNPCSDNRSTKVAVRNRNRNRRIRVRWRTFLNSTGRWRTHDHRVPPGGKTRDLCANRAEILDAIFE